MCLSPDLPCSLLHLSPKIICATVGLLRSMSFAGHFVTWLPTSLPQSGAGSARNGGSASLSFARVDRERPALFARWTATPYDGGRDSA